jgi:DNA-binding CsgD family transcriptional regulator
VKESIALTSLQLQILSAKGKGDTNPEIAWALFRKKSRGPVDNRLNTIYRKLGVDNIVDAIKATIGEIDSPVETLSGLTKDQMRIAKYVLQALTSEQIALCMFFSVANVCYHIGQIYAKSGCRNRAHLTAVYLKHHAA